MKKQQRIFLYIFLGLIFFCGFFLKLGGYHLLDVDETRYVDMARKMFDTKDYFTLYLNGDYFFEKPPFYFWAECLSFKLFGFINEFSARFPSVLISLLPLFLFFSLCKKAKGEKFAFISSFVLLTSVEYIFMTKLAILDSIFASFLVSSILCYFYTFYIDDCRKKYFWLLVYFFSSLAVLTKGIPGAIIPFAVVLFSSLIFKTFKETIKYSWGLIIFFIVVLPWHLIMLKIYGNLFFDEYIIKHHILRFLGSSIINKNQPWHFYILTILWGFFPHIFILLSKIKDIKKIKNIRQDKFLFLNFVAVISILLFFSSSGGKLVTYILPIYPFLSVLAGACWLEFIENNKKENIHLIILNFFLSIAVFGLFFVKYFMSNEIYVNFEQIKIASLIILIPFVGLNWFFVFKQYRLKAFLTLILLMAIISGFLTPLIYKFDYSFGQNDLMNFAKYAKENKYSISTYLTGKKYSLLYYGNQEKVDFQTKNDLAWLKKELSKKEHIVIAKNKDIEKLDLKIKKKGVKYSIIESFSYGK